MVIPVDVSLKKYVNEVMKPQSLDMLGNGEIIIAVFFVWTNIESYEKERQLEI